MRSIVKLITNIKAIVGLVIVWLSGSLVLGLATNAGAVVILALMAFGPMLSGVLLGVKHAGRMSHAVNKISDTQKQHTQLLHSLEKRSTHTNELLDTTIDMLDKRPDAEVVESVFTKGMADTAHWVSQRLDKELRKTFGQFEALQNLHAILPTKMPLPPTRDWAASPDLLLTLVDLTIRGQPKLVVECGSGASTLWLSLTLRQLGTSGRVVALEHDPSFAEATREILRTHHVEDVAEVRDAPLDIFNLDGETYRWYASHTWSGLEPIDLLFIDGPPGPTGKHARYPALPLLHNSLSPDAVVVLDDLIRVDEQEVLQRWMETFVSFEAQILQLEKQAAVVRRRRRTIGDESRQTWF